MTINFPRKNISPIDKFLNDLNEAHLIWAAYNWFEDWKNYDLPYLQILNQHNNLDFLKVKLKESMLNNTGIDSFNQFYLNKRLYFLPSHYFDLLKNNNRLCLLIIMDHKNRLNFDYTNAYYSAIFFIFKKNIDEEKIKYYINIIDNKKNAMSILKKYINNKDFIDWSLDYTKKHSFWFENIFTPKNSQERLKLFLCFWDYSLLKNEYEYECKINKLKKAWQQKEFRDKGGLKKPYHLPLTEKSKKQLKKLSEKNNLSETKVLENLIENAYKNEMLDNNGNILYK